MVVNTKKMMGAEVKTKSGHKIGKVASFNLDPTTGHLLTVEVKPHGLMAGLTADTLLISWDAILEMTEESVTVSDASVKGDVKAVAPTGPIISPTLMKE